MGSGISVSLCICLSHGSVVSSPMATSGLTMTETPLCVAADAVLAHTQMHTRTQLCVLSLRWESATAEVCCMIWLAGYVGITCGSPYFPMFSSPYIHKTVGMIWSFVFNLVTLLTFCSLSVVCKEFYCELSSWM